jgi:hypothetical protein
MILSPAIRSDLLVLALAHLARADHHWWNCEATDPTLLKYEERLV